MAIPLTQLEGKYEILEKLREGGMGAIYKVRHRLLDELRVVKALRPDLQGDPGLRARFLAEARAATQMSHPNIGQVFDCSIDDDGVAFIVMELIPGMTLGELIASARPLPVALAVEIARQSLRALGHLHRHDVVHRDVSPDNLMLTRDVDGQPLVKLIDLGIARDMKSSERLTDVGVFLGKFRYAAPEAFGDGAGVDHRLSDLYAFALVLYELLTGRFPIAGEDASSLVAGHLFRPPLDFAESDPENRVPENVRGAVLKALAKSPAERFADAASFAGALEAVGERDLGTPEIRRILELTRDPDHQPETEVRPPGSTQSRLNMQFAPEPTPPPVEAPSIEEAPTRILRSAGPSPVPEPGEPASSVDDATRIARLSESPRIVEPSEPAPSMEEETRILRPADLPIPSSAETRRFDAAELRELRAEALAATQAKKDEATQLRSEGLVSESAGEDETTRLRTEGLVAESVREDQATLRMTDSESLRALRAEAARVQEGMDIEEGATIIRAPLPGPEPMAQPASPAPASAPPASPAPASAPPAPPAPPAPASAPPVPASAPPAAPVPASAPPAPASAPPAAPGPASATPTTPAPLVEPVAEEAADFDDTLRAIRTLRDEGRAGEAFKRLNQAVRDFGSNQTLQELRYELGEALLERDAEEESASQMFEVAASGEVEPAPPPAPAPAPALSDAPVHGFPDATIRSFDPPAPASPDRPGPPTAHPTRNMVAAGLVLAVVFAALVYVISREGKTEPEQLEAQDVTAADLSPGVLVLDAVPWAEIVTLENPAAEEEELRISPSRFTPVSLRLPPGEYRLTLRYPPTGQVEERVVRVESDARVEERVTFENLDAEQYFQHAGW